MRNKKKIAFIVNDVNFFISHRLVIARKAIKLDYEVYLLSNLADIENKKKLNENKIHYIQIPITRSSKNVFYEIFLFFSIFFNLFKLRPKITHLVTVKPIIYFICICGYTQII